MGTFFKVFFIVALTDRNDLLVGWAWAESFANFCVSVNYCQGQKVAPKVSCQTGSNFGLIPLTKFSSCIIFENI